MTRRLLITGATGAIGHHLVRRLTGERPLLLLVRAADDDAARERVRALIGEFDPTVDVRAADVARRGLGLPTAVLRRLPDRIDGVVHLAARTDFDDPDAAPYRPLHVAGTARLLRLAAAAGVPFVHASTAYVSGDHAGPFAETDHDVGQGFHNGYEQSKWEAERLVRRFADATGLRALILRIGVALPDRPTPGVPSRTGPLAFLEPLASVKRHGSGEPRRRVRSPGDPEGRLSLVPIPWVVDATRRLLASDARGTFHLTAARSLRMHEIATAMGTVLPGIEGQIVPPAAFADADRVERLLARRTRVYQPYQRLHAAYDRTRLEAALGPAAATDGADPAWLARVLAAHLADWRAAGRVAAPAAAPPPERGPLDRYFGEFLSARCGQPLLPGLTRLDAAFSVATDGGRRWGLRIERGVLKRVTADASGDWEYTLSPADLLAVVAGQARASALFFERQIRIDGALHPALATAAVLDEFFDRNPYCHE